MSNKNSKHTSSIGDNWENYKNALLTAQERKEIDIKVQLITEILRARENQGLTQKQLEQASGVKQPIIARLEKGTTDPQLTTVLKILRPLGKTLAIVPLFYKVTKKRKSKA